MHASAGRENYVCPLPLSLSPLSRGEGIGGRVCRGRLKKLRSGP